MTPVPASRHTADTLEGERFDVVVVGARCAGAATALLLARAGARVALVDRGDEGRDTLSTHAFTRAGVLQLHRWGLLDRIRAAGTPPVRRTVFRYGDASTVVTLRSVGGVDALYAPRRTVLDPILVDAARAAGARVAYGARVTGVTSDPDGRVTGVAGRGPDGRPFELAATWTVGADGVHSRLARSVGAPVEQRGRHASAFLFGYLAGLEADAYEWCYAPGAASVVIPTNDGQACVSVAAPPARLRAEVALGACAAFHRLLGEASPELAARVAAAATPLHLRVFPGLPGFARRPWGPGWALVGDAGYYKDPISSHGMSAALRDAELLARALVVALEHQGSGGPALREFHRTRDRLSRRLFEVTDEIASYHWDTRSIEHLLRSLSAAMSDEVEHLLGLGPPAVAAARLAG
jgi:flavin-dependent dehydrogenase